jgi:hypothetical protein
MDEAISSLLFHKDVIAIHTPDVIQDGRESDGRRSADRDPNLSRVLDYYYRGIEKLRRLVTQFVCSGTVVNSNNIVRN